MARMLITGGAGFIGSYLCERFLAEGDEVICMDNLITGNADNVAHLFPNRRFSYISVAIRNAGENNDLAVLGRLSQHGPHETQPVWVRIA